MKEYTVTKKEKTRHEKTIKLRREIIVAEYRLAELRLKKQKLDLGIK